MHTDHRAKQITFFDFTSPPMRAFHMTWFAFFLSFFAWFGIAPLMQVVRAELNLTRDQIGWCIIGSVAITVLVRLVIGWACDRYGPRLAYTAVLVGSSAPVMAIGLAHSFETFLICRVLIGAIGASFVVTQYHASVMFAPRCVGTANAVTAGWGNLGGGVAQLVMPLLFAFFVTVLGFSDSAGWRASMFVAGIACLLTGIAYYFLTQDLPEGNYKELRAAGMLPPSKHVRGTFMLALRDYRVWILFVVYGACFGLELTIDNIAALYFTDYFGLGLTAAGVAAGAFGLMNIFARALGGWIADRCGARWGLVGRVRWLFVVILCEGLTLVLFSRMSLIALAIPAMMLFGLFVKMSNGATYAVVPFVNRRALGSIAGIVGAGGNAGAVAAGFLFKGSLDWPTGLFILGLAVTATAFLTPFLRLSSEPAAQPVPALELAGAATAY